MKTKTLQRLAYAAFGANLLLAIAGAASARAETTIITQRTYNGWITHVWRGPVPAVPGVNVLDWEAPPNDCDRAGTPGFQIVTGHGAGACVGGRRRAR